MQFKTSDGRLLRVQNGFQNCVFYLIKCILHGYNVEVIFIYNKGQTILTSWKTYSTR